MGSLPGPVAFPSSRCGLLVPTQLPACPRIIRLFLITSQWGWEWPEELAAWGRREWASQRRWPLGWVLGEEQNTQR